MRLKNSALMLLSFVTNPLDAMVWSLKKITKIKKKNIVGMAGILDSARLKFFLSNEIGVAMDNPLKQWFRRTW